jgi:hypothetical protein
MSDTAWMDAFDRLDRQRQMTITLTNRDVGAMAGLAALLSPPPPYSTAPRRAVEGPSKPWLKHQPGTKQRKRFLQKQARKRNRA